ncbi:hypothetical protein LTS01_005835 [Friedmanniomyces endolithicus]|nr:hypothetical protein LTS01_005835 [Friedmanniomyces endolithicus]
MAPFLSNATSRMTCGSPEHSSDILDWQWRTDSKTGVCRRAGIARMAPGVVEVLGVGTSSLVGLLDDGHILKYPVVEGECANEFNAEAAIYEALGDHPRIIGYLGRTKDGLKLERGNRLTESLETTDDLALKLRWARQAAEGLGYLHSRGVIHCDLHPDNLLLDDEKNLKMCDFQGKMGDFDGKAMERERYCLPRSDDDYTPSIQSDIFALGSTIFRIMTGSEPYQDLPDEDIEPKFRQLDFPATDFIAAKYSGIWPCKGGTFSCQLGNCTETFSIPSGGLTINDATLRALNVSQSAAGTAATAAASTVTVTPSALAATSTVTVAPTALAGDYVSRGVAAGIGAGIGVPLLCALVAVSALLVLEKRRHKNVQSTDEPATRSGGQDLPEAYSPQSRRGDGREGEHHGMAPAKPQELDNQQRLFELANGPR